MLDLNNHITNETSNGYSYSMIKRIDSIPEEDEGASPIDIQIAPDQSQSHGDDEDLDLILQSIKHSPYDDEIWMNKSEAEALGQYDDFHTIDWSRDRMRDRIRFRQFRKMKYQGTLLEKLKVGCIFFIDR